MAANKRARERYACFFGCLAGGVFYQEVKNENDRQIDLRNAFAGADVDGRHGIGGR
jgi:hypothetical protein